MPDPAGPDPAGRAPGAPASDQAPAKLVMAFDFGQRRIGMACGDTVSRTASPLRGIDNGGAGPRWDAIDARVREWQPNLLVVGLPYNADGSEGTTAGAARAPPETARMPRADKPRSLSMMMPVSVRPSVADASMTYGPR